MANDYAKWGLTQTNNMIGGEEGQQRDESDFYPGVEGVLRSRGIDPKGAFGDFGANDVTPGWQVPGGDPKAMYYPIQGDLTKAYDWLPPEQLAQLQSQMVNGMLPVKTVSALAQSSPYKYGNQSGDGLGGLTDALSGWMDNGGLVNLASTMFMGGALGGAFGGAEAGVNAGGLDGALGDSLANQPWWKSAESIAPNFTSNVNDLTSNNWYDSMTPQDLGEAVNPWTTDPSFEDLMNPGSPSTFPDVPPGIPRPDSSYNPDAEATGPSATTNPTGIPGAPLSVFDKFLKGILDNPIKSALSAGQILSGISTANRAMSPQQARAMADPFSPYRQQYINQLNALMANPALAMSQPGYQFQRQQGEQALNRKLAVRGMGSYTPDGRGSASGGADIARMKYGQEYALGSYNDYVKQLSGLAGANQAPSIGGQAALSAQTAAASAATQGWGAINQGIGTLQGIMKAAPSGNPNNSGWSTPATPGFQGAFPGGVPYSDMPAYSGNVPSNNPSWFGSSSGEPSYPLYQDYSGWGAT